MKSTMKSTMAVTSEIDDISGAVSELTEQINKDFTFKRNSIGIIYCDADTDVSQLSDSLHKELGIDIVGLTTTASLERNTGYSDMGILLCVLTADDINFSVGSSGDLDNYTYADSIKNSYIKAREPLSGDPKLILALAPYIADLSSDNYVQALESAAGGIPVFGGVATDHYDLKYQKTFFNGEEYTRGLVFVLFEGNIKPVFAMEHHFSGKVDNKGIVTKSSGTFVEKIGDRTFMEYVTEMVPFPDEEIVIFHFQSTPFIVELPDFDKDEQPVVRAVCTIDKETGKGGFLTNIPEGSTVYFNILQRENLEESCTAAISNIVEEINRSHDYEYSMVFVSTCNARHSLMGVDKDMESEILSERLRDFPKGLNMMGC